VLASEHDSVKISAEEYAELEINCEVSSVFGSSDTEVIRIANEFDIDSAFYFQYRKKHYSAIIRNGSSGTRTTL
jgi:hypothetical protein